MIGDYIIWALVFLLIGGVIHLLADCLVQYGIPYDIAQIVGCIVILAIFYKSQTDRYLLRRYHRKWKDWHGRPR